MNFCRKGEQCLPVRNPVPMACGRRFRAFKMTYDFNYDVMAIEIDLNIPAYRVTRVLDRSVVSRGYLLKMRIDNGPELVSLMLAQFSEEHSVRIEFIKQCKYTQNSYIERVNRTYRTDIQILNS